MTSPDGLAEWLDKFKADYGLDDLLLGDGDLADERAEFAAAYVEETLPPRYQYAIPTVPAVLEWTAGVVRAAVDDSQARGRRVATVHQGPSLLILGATGVGKTFEAYGAMRVISALGLHARWQVVPAGDFYARLRPRHGVDPEGEFDRVADAPLLVLDDLGAVKHSEWVEDVNLRLVNRRYNSIKPTLFTSNVVPKELTERLGDRVASRLVEMTERVVIEGDDRRRAA